jgi:hypothetical protein
MRRRRTGVTPDAVRERLLRVTADLPEESYVLDESEDASAMAGGKIFRLSATSQDRQCATATIYAVNDPHPAGDVLVEVGADSRFEIQIGGRWRQFGLESALDRVEALVRAVVEGWVRERLWSSDEGIAKSKISFLIGDREVTGSTRKLGLRMRGTTESVIDYAPYAETRR